jgi:hypothetical protein
MKREQNLIDLGKRYGQCTPSSTHSRAIPKSSRGQCNRLRRRIRMEQGGFFCILIIALKIIQEREIFPSFSVQWRPYLSVDNEGGTSSPRYNGTFLLPSEYSLEFSHVQNIPLRNSWEFFHDSKLKSSPFQA